MKVLTAIGLMSGTSMDGIDLALVRTDGESGLEFGPTMAVDYSSDVRRRIEHSLADAAVMTDRDQRPGSLADTERLVTDQHVDALRRFLRIHSIDPGEIDLLGFHGQTVLHRPKAKLTVQLGDGARLARETGIDTVFDMRANDIRHCGQGAPLVPVFHQALAQNAELQPPVGFVNIGGIANITFIGSDGALLAFDTGPGNALIDQWLQTEAGIPMDAGGRIASEGGIVRDIVDRYLAVPFFEQGVPKSLDRGDFEPLPAGAAELADGARSLARVTAESVVKAVDHLPEKPTRWIVCGGGRLNATIMADLKECTAPAEVVSAEALEFNGDMIEAQAFAYLAVRSKRGLPLTFPGTTGCLEPVTGGVFAKAW